MLRAFFLCNQTNSDRVIITRLSVEFPLIFLNIDALRGESWDWRFLGRGCRSDPTPISADFFRLSTNFSRKTSKWTSLCKCIIFLVESFFDGWQVHFVLHDSLSTFSKLLLSLCFLAFTVAYVMKLMGFFHESPRRIFVLSLNIL